MHIYSKRETSGPENGASVKRVRSGDAPPSLVNRALAGLSRGDRGSSYRGSRGGRRVRGRGRGFW